MEMSNAAVNVAKLTVKPFAKADEQVSTAKSLKL